MKDVLLLLTIYVLCVWIAVKMIIADTEQQDNKESLNTPAHKVQMCERWGNKCELYACYKTEKGKFICPIEPQ